VWDYEHTRWEALLVMYDSADVSGVYRLDESEPPEINLHFVFTDTRALSVVRFRSFLRDCRAVERPVGELERVLKTEEAALEHFIADQHAEIRRTFDPNVRRIAKRRKIMVMKGAFD
jgi:hypothetical protein